MRRWAFFVVLLGLLLVPIRNAAEAQRIECSRVDSCHGLGDMAMSPDARFVAFYINGMPASQFALFNTNTHQVFIIQAPPAHRQIGDLSWSPDGDELTFVTAERSVLGGEGQHVWRLRPGESAPVLELLALIPHVSHPVLSADGARLAAFEGVIGPNDIPGLVSAYGVFERSVADGRSVRRSEGYVSVAWGLHYDLRDDLILSLYQPIFARWLPHETGSHQTFTWSNSDASGRSDFSWDADIGRVYAFRLPPNETLPVWPTPYPSRGAPEGARAVRPLNDGRVVVYASLDPANSYSRNLRDWYNETGSPRTPTRQMEYGFIAYSGDGAGEVLPTLPFPENGARTGGADVSGDGRYFAQIVSDHVLRGVHTPREAQAWDSQDTLLFYDGGTLVFQARIADLLQQASTIGAQLGRDPIMPVETIEPHRISAPPQDQGLPNK